MYMKSAWTPVSKSVWTYFVIVVKFTHVFTHMFSKSVAVQEGCLPYYATKYTKARKLEVPDIQEVWGKKSLMVEMWPVLMPY